MYKFYSGLLKMEQIVSTESIKYDRSSKIVVIFTSKVAVQSFLFVRFHLPSTVMAFIYSTADKM